MCFPDEEIDVVSVGEKHGGRKESILPNNPSLHDKQQLQRTMETAITNKKLSYDSTLKVKLSTDALKKRHSNLMRRSQRVNQPYNVVSVKKRVMYSSDSEQEPLEKRSLHNNMERQRRIDLRNAFEELRLVVPEVAKKGRAAKVVILREAATYCDRLGSMSELMEKELVDLRKQQEFLRTRVSQLRRCFAAKHR